MIPAQPPDLFIEGGGSRRRDPEMPATAVKTFQVTFPQQRTTIPHRAGLE